jgi:hypothetical protein
MKQAGGWLSVLTALFLVRVIAQPLALVIDHPLLPRFSAWQSGLLSYPWLVAFQVLILAVMSLTAWQASRSLLTPRPRLGKTLLALGAVYLAGTVARLALGLTIWADSSFFAKPVPSVFHLVLATFVLVCGYHHTGAALADRQTRRVK